LAQKLEIVAESQVSGANVTAVARRLDVHPNLIHVWRPKRAADTPAGEVRFAPVAVSRDSNGCGNAVDPGVWPMIELVLGNGRAFRGNPHFTDDKEQAIGSRRAK
jgi:hypothetical protein